MTYKVARDIWYVELYIFEIPDSKNLQNKNKIIALASLEQEIYERSRLESRDLFVQGHASSLQCSDVFI